MSSFEERAKHLSAVYYNRGLERAGIRDLSGAVTQLLISLKFNKENMDARNLLGLIYFETGETGSALREWMISRNLHPAENPAIDYIRQVQADQARLNAVNRTLVEFNEALRTCKEGHDDVAAITLRKVLTRNPKLLKAYQLLGLIEFREGRYAHASRTLKKALKIDHTNPTTLRYLRAVEEAAGGSSALKRHSSKDEEGDATTKAKAPYPSRFRETPAFVNLVNVLIGLAIGMLAVWFVIAPAVRKNAAREADEKVMEYSNVMATQEDRITQLESQVAEYTDSVQNAQSAQQNSENAVTSYDNLLRAYNDYQNANYLAAGDEIAAVDVSLLSTSAADIYNAIRNAINDEAYSLYVRNGEEAYYAENWPEAITAFEHAAAIDATDYEVLDLLALAYQNNLENDKAIEAYQKIIDTFPGTRRAEYAENSITALGGTPVVNDAAAPVLFPL